MIFSEWECVLGAAFLVHAWSVPSILGFVWLGLFFYWGAAWVQPPNDKPSRGYTFWVVVMLLAVIHFVLQLGAQILYMQGQYHRSKWLDVLGFPNKTRTFDKFLVILPAALCCSLTAVQVGFLFLRHTPPRKSSLYDPGSALRAHNKWVLYLTACAAPHSAAGPLAAFAIIASCAVWPTPLNAVAAAVLLNRVRSWSLEPPVPRVALSPASSPTASPPASPRNRTASPRSPLAGDFVYSNLLTPGDGPQDRSNLPEESRFAPFLKAYEAELLAVWVAFQITFSNILQMPLLASYAKSDVLKWANIGIMVDPPQAPNVQNGVRVALHAVLLAALYLFLTAVRCSADPNTRLWPKRSPFVSHVAAFLDALPDGHSPGSRLAAMGDPARHLSPLGLNGPLQSPGEGYRAIGGAYEEVAGTAQHEHPHTLPGSWHREAGGHDQGPEATFLSRQSSLQRIACFIQLAPEETFGAGAGATAHGGGPNSMLHAQDSLQHPPGGFSVAQGTQGRLQIDLLAAVSHAAAAAGDLPPGGPSHGPHMTTGSHPVDGSGVGDLSVAQGTVRAVPAFAGEGPLYGGAYDPSSMGFLTAADGSLDPVWMPAGSTDGVDSNQIDATDIIGPPPWPSTVSILSGVSAHAAMSLFYSPALLAFACAVFAFAFPSGLSACLLLLSLYQLLISPQTGVQLLTSHADSLLLMISSWFLISYCAVASGAAALLPGFLQALMCTTEARTVQLGVFLPLATTSCFAFIVVAVASHSRAHNGGPLWPSIRNRAMPSAVPVSSASSREDPRTSSHLTSGVSVAATLLVHTLGNVVVPVLWFALGVFRLCPAGTFYAVGPALEVLPFQALLAPPEEPQRLSLTRHSLMRSYAALHIALLYCLGLVPGRSMPWWVAAARDFLAGDDLDTVMPHVATIAAVMVIATGHAIIGTWLKDSMDASGTTPVPGAHGSAHADHSPGSAYHTPSPSRGSSREFKEVEESDVVVPLLAAPAAPPASSLPATAGPFGAENGTGSPDAGAHSSGDRGLHSRREPVPHLPRIVSGSRAAVPAPDFIQVAAPRQQRAKEKGVKDMWLRWHSAVRWMAWGTRHVGLHVAAAVGLALTLLCFEVSMTATLFLSLWLLVLLMPPIATTADSQAQGRQQLHLRMHRTIILVIPCIVTMHILLLYVDAVRRHVDFEEPWLKVGASNMHASRVMHHGAQTSVHSPDGVVSHTVCVAMYASFAMLLTLAMYRALWLLDASAASPQECEPTTLLQQLRHEETLLALLKRFLIRRSFQFVLVAVAAQSLMCPSIIGALFLVGSVSCMLAFGVATGVQPVTASVLAAVASGLWTVLQYAVCSEWLQAVVHVAEEDSSMVGVLKVLGVPALQGGGLPQAPLLTTIGQKLLAVFSVCLLHRCQYWRRSLLPILLSAAPPGALCVLFWPPAGMDLVAEPPPAAASAAGAGAGDSLLAHQHGRSDLWWRRWTAKGIATSARALLRTLSLQMVPSKLPAAHSGGTAAQRAASVRLEEPAQRLADSAAPTGNPVAVAHAAASSVGLEAPGRKGTQPSPSQGAAVPFFYRVLLSIASVLLRLTEHTARALMAVTHTFQWLLEDVASICAADALVFLLVLISLLAFEALSFLYIAAAAIGMFQEHIRTHTLPVRLAPFLAVVAVLQYCFYIAFPDESAPSPPAPPPDVYAGARDYSSNLALLHWLGFAPTMTQLMVLLATTAVAASAKHTMLWLEATDPSSEAVSAAGSRSVSSFSSSPQRHALYYDVRAAGLIDDRLSDDRLSVPLTTAAAAPALKVVAEWHTGSIPEEVFNGRSLWGWPQWFRFWIFRLSLDILMVLMVALCTIQRDFIHAAYLALTLWLFRRREELRRQGNELFFWLPFANLCVIILMLIFQAPWQELLDWLPHHGAALQPLLRLPHTDMRALAQHTLASVASLWSAESPFLGVLPVGDEVPGDVREEGGWWSSSPECSWGHLLGLHRIRNAGRWQALELTPHGAGIPLLMWLAIQVQSRLLDAKGFRDTYAQLLKDQALLRSAVRDRRDEDVQGSMRRCIQLSRVRDARRQRLERLKRTLDHSRGFLGADPQTLLEFWDPTRRNSNTSQPASSSPPPAERTPRHTPPALSPDLTGKPASAHNRKASTSGAAPHFGRNRESSSGATMHAASIHAEHHRDGSGVPNISGPRLQGVVVPASRRESHAGTAGDGAAAGPLQRAEGVLASPETNTEFEDALPGTLVTAVIASTITTLSQVAFHVHLLFALCFLSDLSAASAVFPLSSLLYTLVSEPRPIFWRVLLVYAEALLVLQYIYQVVLKAGCLELNTDGHQLLRRLGIHESVYESVPLFMCYLVLLMHNYFVSLVTPQPGSMREAVCFKPSFPSASPGLRFMHWTATSAAWLYARLLVLFSYLHVLCNEAAFAPHCLLIQIEEKRLDVTKSVEGQDALTSTLTAALEALSRVDMVLAASRSNLARDGPVTTAIQEQHPSMKPALQLGYHEVEELQATLAVAQHASFSGAACAPVLVTCHRVEQLQPGRVSMLCQVFSRAVPIDFEWQLYALPWWQRWPAQYGAGVMRLPALKPAESAARGLQRLLRLNKLNAAVAAASAVPAGGELTAPEAEESVQRPRTVPTSPRITISPRGLAVSSTSNLRQLREGAGSSPDAGANMQPSSRSQSAAVLSSVTSPAPMSPARPPSTNDAISHALSDRVYGGDDGNPVLPSEGGALPAVRSRSAGASPTHQDHEAEHNMLEDGHLDVHALAAPWLASQMVISDDIVWHSKGGADWYTLTLAVNTCSFVYAAVTCQGLVANHANGQADSLAAGHSINAAYLVTLIVIFLSIALDRFIYSLGSTRARAVLLLVEVALYFSAAGALGWRASVSEQDLWNLKVFMALKIAAMSLTAVQVRAGYPSVQESMAAGSGQGRHSFYFYRHVNALHWVGFQIFRMVPFLYEIKAMLDWSVTSTTLTIVDWLKLEDIKASLYNRQCDLQMRAATRPTLGLPQPHTGKFVAGTLVCSGIIGLLWTPLLLYSSSNPTYKVPLVSDFMFNVTLIYKTHNETGHPLGQTRVPLFQSTEQYTVLPWLKASKPEVLPGTLAAYDATQLRLMCGSEDSDTMWMPATPLRDQLIQVLASEGLRGRRTSPSALAAATQHLGGTPALQGNLTHGGHLLDAPVAHAGAWQESAEQVVELHAQAFYAQKLPRVWVEFGFSTLRDKPLPTAYGGPGCEGRARLQLDSHAVMALHDVLTKRQRSGALLTGWQQHAHGAFVSAGAARNSSSGGFMWVWQLKYQKCNVVPVSTEHIVTAHPGNPHLGSAKLANWPKFRVACKLALRGVQPKEWWQMHCQALSSNDKPLVDTAITERGADSAWQLTHPGERRNSPKRDIADILHLRCPASEYVGSDASMHGAHAAGELGWGPPMVVAALERVQAGTIGEAVVSLGITGLYVTIVFGLGRFARLSIANMRMRIPYQDLPEVSHLWTLCSDITVAREEGEFMLEEQLFYTLINLYRSPQVLFELTKKAL